MLYFQTVITFIVVILTVGIAVILVATRFGNQRANQRPPTFSSGFAITQNPSSASASASSSNTAVAAVKQAFREEGKGGIIVKNKMNHTCIAVEFYGPAGFDGKSIEVEFVQSSNVNPAKVFLQGESYKVLDLEKGTFGSFRAILMQNSRPTGRIDVASGCAIYEGIVP